MTRSRFEAWWDRVLDALEKKLWLPSPWEPRHDHASILRGNPMMRKLHDQQREAVKAKLSAEVGLERRPDPNGGTYLFDGQGRRVGWVGLFSDLGVTA